MSLSSIEKYLQEHMSGKYLKNAKMNGYTSFKIGGPADLLAFPSTKEELAGLLECVRKEKEPLTIMGNGSNLLVRDKGIRGLVVKLGNGLKEMTWDGAVLKAGAGVSLAAVSQKAASLGLTGMEFAVGIPGSLGGAVFMNAGAYNGEMKNVVKTVMVLTATGEFSTYCNSGLDFSYRHSILQGTDNIVVEVELSMQKGNPETIKADMDDFTQRRITKQPIDLPSAGSMFKRPTGYYAAALIDEAGLRGYRVGDAQVSEKHTGFVVNVGKATAQDVLQLIKDVQKKVYIHCGVRLEPEVRVIGEE